MTLREITTLNIKTLPYFMVDKNILIELVKMRMPYGKYKGTILCDLPEFYLAWYQQKGFPDGKIGVLLGTLYEIKLNGLEYLLREIRKM